MKFYLGFLLGCALIIGTQTLALKTNLQLISDVRVEIAHCEKIFSEPCVPAAWPKSWDLALNNQTEL